EVDDAAGDLLRIGRQLELQLGVGEQRREVLEARSDARVLGRQAADVVDPEERGVLLVACLGARRAGDEVALAQREPSYLRRRHVHVLLRGQVAAATQEAVALGPEVEQALDRDRIALVLGGPGVARLVLAAATAATAPAPAVALAERLPLVLGVD